MTARPSRSDRRGNRVVTSRDFIRTLRMALAERCHEDARRARRSIASDLLQWARIYLPEHVSLPPSRLHVWLAEQLALADARRGMRINVVGPRGGAKSTIGTLCYVLRCAVERREPYIWIVSDTSHQAAMHLENIKEELEENPLLHRDYPEGAGRGPLWQRNRIVLRNGAAVEAHGTGQRIRGRRKSQHRPSLIVCDDLQNDAHAASPRLRAASWRWFQGTLMKAGTRNTNVLHLATALHREALGWELHRTPGWFSCIFPAIVRWPTHMELWQEWEGIYADVRLPDAQTRARGFFERHREAMEAGAELLWPEHEDLYALMCMRAEGGKAAFEREKQGVPLNPRECEFPEDYFDEAIWFDDWPRETLLRVVSLDPSQGQDARHGDFSALVLLAVAPCGLLYADADLARRPTARIIEDAATTSAMFCPAAFVTETNQYQDLLRAELEREFQRRGLVGMPVYGVDNRVNKRVRIRRLGPLLGSKRLRFRSGSIGARMLVDQLRDFPVGDHDDGPDALEMALRVAEELLRPRPGDGLGCNVLG